MIKVVEIISTSAHPNASKLKICEVSDGSKKTIVVCGASNVRENMKTILAEVGDILPTGVTIQASELRGVKSFGMLCSAKDLHISQEAGIVDLPSDCKTGEDVKSIDKELLSSTPWHLYKEIDSFWDNGNGQILVLRDGQKPKDNLKLLSKTYYFNDQYLHRNFK